MGASQLVGLQVMPLQPGLADLLALRRFMTETVGFADLHPAPELLAASDAATGYRPQALATEAGDRQLFYLPAGGTITLSNPAPAGKARWFNTCKAELQAAEPVQENSFTAPTQNDPDGRPQDFILWLGR